MEPVYKDGVPEPWGLAALSFEEAELIRRRARAFLRLAEALVEEGEYDLAMFSLEQYCQLILKYKLLVLEGSYPRTHSLRRLIRELGRYEPRVLELVDDVGKLHYIARLEEAYIASRYLPITYEEREVRDILAFVKGCSGGLSREQKPSPLKVLGNYLEIARSVKDIVKTIDPQARIYVFGSVVKRRYTAASDIDVLVITENIREKYRIMTEVYRRIDAPVELHVVTKRQFESWYKRFITEDSIVEV